MGERAPQEFPAPSMTPSEPPEAPVTAVIPTYNRAVDLER